MSEATIKAIFYIFVIALGYLLKEKGMFETRDAQVLSKIVLKITLPCAIVVNISKIKIESSMLYLIGFGLMVNIIQMAVGLFMARKGSREDKLFYMLNMSGQNIGIFTMPYILGFFGPMGMAAASIFDTGNSLMCTGGADLLAAGMFGEKKKGRGKEFAKRLLSSVALITYIVMFLLSGAGIKLPGFILTAATIPAGCNAFLAMMMLGIGFDLKLDKRKGKDAAKVLFARYALTAIFIWIILAVLPADPEMKKALAICAAAPIGAMLPVFTRANGGDFELASTVNSLSVLISIPLVNILLMVL